VNTHLFSIVPVRQSTLMAYSDIIFAISPLDSLISNLASSIVGFVVIPFTYENKYACFNSEETFDFSVEDTAFRNKATISGLLLFSCIKSVI
jgi:hypothetical protein